MKKLFFIIILFPFAVGAIICSKFIKLLESSEGSFSEARKFWEKFF